MESKAILGNPIIDSKFAHHRPKKPLISVTVPLDHSPSWSQSHSVFAFICIPSTITKLTWMFLGINLKFANQIGDIYWRDKARSTGSASRKRERVTINWGRGESLQQRTLQCGFTDGNERSPFLRIHRESRFKYNS